MAAVLRVKKEIPVNIGLEWGEHGTDDTGSLQTAGAGVVTVG